jgi:hypothetical protein
MVDSVPVFAASRLFLYCNKGADNPTMNLWSTLVITQLQIFAAHTCTTVFVVTKRMKSMTAHFGLGNQAISSASADAYHSRTTRSPDRLAHQQRTGRCEVLPYGDETAGPIWGDGESQRQIMRTFRYEVTRDIEDERAEGANQFTCDASSTWAHEIAPSSERS